jgi:hypothetical protein
MKQLLITTLLFLSLKVEALLPVCQQTENYRDKAFEALKNLDKTNVPGGALYEYVYPMANIGNFKGLTGTDTCNTGHFLEAWHEVYEFSFNSIEINNIRKFN